MTQMSQKDFYISGPVQLEDTNTSSSRNVPGYLSEKNSFFFRVTDPWNSLPCHVVDAPNVKTFEARLDKHWQSLPLNYEYEEPPTLTHAQTNIYKISFDKELTPEAIELAQNKPEADLLVKTFSYNELLHMKFDHVMLRLYILIIAYKLLFFYYKAISVLENRPLKVYKVLRLVPLPTIRMISCDLKHGFDKTYCCVLIFRLHSEQTNMPQSALL